MRSAKAGPLRLRTLRFERCEDRIVLSSRAAADFSLDDLLLQQPGDEFEQVEIALNDVHDDFGVTYARNAFGFEGQGQTVAVIDTGVAYDHAALGGGLGAGYRVVGGWDFTEENDANPYDDGPAGFHGTHVAGIVGSDDARYTGVAPGVDIVALRVFNDQGAGYFEWVERALRWLHVHRNDFANPVTTVTLSLGGDWNADTTPSWATLEEELAALNRDGIFVAVAAGNDFTSYRTAGLSYPAASPYVVPVASVNNYGRLSSFSQRNYRVLAAPGDQITSTVPDYLYSFDGVTNDFATASGTSMAAPYVAGASILVREAFEFAGYTDVSQETIYRQLYDTADLVYDARTAQSYHRIDLQAALDAIMPADDFGSTTATAHGLGTLSAEVTGTGVIGRLDDVDYFRFTAGSTGSASFSVTASGLLLPEIELHGGGAQADGSAIEFDVVAGRQYVVGVGTSGGIGHYATRLDISSQVVDLGVVDLVEFAGQPTVDGEAYRFTAARSGLVTVEAFFAQLPANAVIRLTDGRGVVLAGRAVNGTSAQFGFTAVAGEQYTLTVNRAGEGTKYRISNVFEGVPKSLELVFEDFTGDGRLDVLGQSAAGDWWLARGTDHGYVSSYAGKWNTRAKWVDVVVDDFDNDGRLDVLGRTVSGQWWVSLDTGTGRVSRFAGRWRTTMQWQDVKIGDFTGDGQDDFLARNERGRWWLANRRVANQRARIYGNWGHRAEWTDVTVGDFNADGLLDVIGRKTTGQWFLAENSGSRLVNRGWGSWNSSVTWTDVMVDDFTGDGLPDIVGRNGAGKWYMARNTGARFVSRWWGGWNPATEWSDVMSGDFTGDGLPDIVGRATSGRWYLAENRGRRFVNHQWGLWSPSTAWSEVLKGDFTGDGLLDVAGRTMSGDWYVSENTSAGFVNRPWLASYAPGTEPETGVGSAGFVGPLPASSSTGGFESWLASDEGSKVADHWLNESKLPAAWAKASQLAFQ